MIISTSCPFCTSARVEGRTLKEGDHTYVLFSNPRLMPGHILVIPKRHVLKTSELAQKERAELFDMLIEFQEKILGNLAEGCDIRQSYKPYVKNSRTKVDHLHFHLYPRHAQDELYEKVEVDKEPLYQDLTEEEYERVMGLLA